MKEPEFDDPMELKGVVCDGDPDFMIDVVIEEYLRMGSAQEQVLQLFESPCYPLLHHVLQAQGAEAIRKRIERVSARCGVFRFRTSHPPEPLEFVTIAPFTGGGSDNDQGL